MAASRCTAGWKREVYVDRTLVDGDCAVAFLYDYAGYVYLAAAYCINCFHARLFQCVDVDNFGVLCLVGMIRAVVDVHVRDDAASEAVFRKHALHHMDVQGWYPGLRCLLNDFCMRRSGEVSRCPPGYPVKLR